MIANISQSFLSDVPKPPSDFIYVPKDTPGKYVFGEVTFSPNRTFHGPAWHQRAINTTIGDDWLVGVVTIFFIAACTEFLLSCCERTLTICFPEKTSRKSFAKDVEELLSFDLVSFFKRIGKESRRQQLSVCRETSVMLLSLLLLLGSTAVIFATQTRKYPSRPFEYNLQGSHPVGTEPGLGLFMRRNFRERPCITPVFHDSNPIRNFSISTCYSVTLNEAHKREEDRVSSVTIGSWFHKGGGDHHVRFGDATITVMTRAFIYGTPHGTYRLLFPNLRDNYVSVTQYLHQLVIHKILNDSCHDQKSMKTCEELFSEHRIEAKVVAKKIRLWLPRNKTDERFVLPQGLETTLRAEFHDPWKRVFQSIGPLLTAELIEEVKGTGSYVHIAHEKEEEDLPGLLYLEAKRFGVILFSISLSIATALLFLVKCFGGTRRDSSTPCACPKHPSPPILVEVRNERGSAADHSSAPSKIDIVLS